MELLWSCPQLDARDLDRKSSCSTASDVQTTQSPQPTELLTHCLQVEQGRQVQALWAISSVCESFWSACGLQPELMQELDARVTGSSNLSWNSVCEIWFRHWVAALSTALEVFATLYYTKRLSYDEHSTSVSACTPPKASGPVDMLCVIHSW
jgi:hypothetical protein